MGNAITSLLNSYSNQSGYSICGIYILRPAVHAYCKRLCAGEVNGLLVRLAKHLCPLLSSQSSISFTQALTFHTWHNWSYISPRVYWTTEGSCLWWL